MGKGDRKTAKGKRYVASYGNARSHSATKKPVVAATATAVKKPAAAAATKAPAARKAAPAKKKA